MDKFFITCMLGIAVGAVDILPMVKMKLDKYSIASAFVFYFTLPFIILNTELFHVVWWIKGGLSGGILALPMMARGTVMPFKLLTPIVAPNTNSRSFICH